jgi:AP2 domain
MKAVKFDIHSKTHGHFEFWVDECDAWKIPYFRWRIRFGKTRNNVYVVTDYNRKKIYLHRLLTDFKWEKVDHKNGDPLNNRQENLRDGTEHNQKNSNKATHASGIPPTSKYKGVTWYKRCKKWVAQMRIKNVKTHLGYFTDEIDAAKAYDKAAHEHFGEYACLNFPEDYK